MTILILGGTAEARALAQAALDSGLLVVSSLAGRVSNPLLPVGDVRIGGFGGVPGLRQFLVDQRISAVVDATHPFAVQMSRHAVAATAGVDCPLLRLARPGWSDHPGADTWTWVADTWAALGATDAQRPFLTTGRQSLDTFLAWSDRDVLVRVVDPPAFALPPRWHLIRSRGPYRIEAERRLMLDHGVEALVTKDSGGPYTSAKLDAAADLGIAVVVISRPALPSGAPEVGTVTAALHWLDDTLPG